VVTTVLNKYFDTHKIILDEELRPEWISDEHSVHLALKMNDLLSLMLISP